MVDWYLLCISTVADGLDEVISIVKYFPGLPCWQVGSNFVCLVWSLALVLLQLSLLLTRGTLYGCSLSLICCLTRLLLLSRVLGVLRIVALGWAVYGVRHWVLESFRPLVLDW